MPVTVFSDIKQQVLDRLSALDNRLAYHNINHTLDVVMRAEQIAKAEHITDAEEIFLLKVAALYHDTGFLEVYTGHEEISCRIFLEDADRFGFTPNQKKIITSLILATKVPQQPKTHLQKIICDADLDYLGREDFYLLGQKLKKELMQFKLITGNAQWQIMQATFLKEHHYHTFFSKTTRESVKQMHYDLLVHKGSD